MNAAAEFLVLWHLNRCDISDEDRTTLVDALKRGHDLGESDAIELVSAYIGLAVDGSRGLPDAEIVDLMIRLHKLHEANSQEERTIDAMLDVQKILADQRPGPFSERIVSAKVAGIVQKLNAHAAKI
ncbi:hypothetical protein [Rhizobium sp. MHM7A]|uniref:hypothetical protein n=1 Tax=Rhizobium sp. MHM7A TaxID=2583233 RepID=UPI001105F505|nr:hypothetical protein [Rhizobium sp. MHM7A]TLX16661.1 hypothetical protein FFR93_04785 [Rhizobium sp. MHM7A]